MELTTALLPFLYPQRWRVLAAYGLTAVGVVLSLALPWPMKYLIDNVLTGEGDADVPWLGAMSDGAAVATLALGMALLAAASASALAAEKIQHARIRERYGLDLRAALIETVYGLSLKSRLAARSGELTLRLVSDSQFVGRLFCRTLPTLLKDLLMAGALLVMTLVIDARIGGVALAMAAALYVVFRRLGPVISAAARHRRQLEGRVAALTQESVAAIEHIQSMGLEKQARRRYLEEIRGSLGAGVGEVQAAVRLERAAQMLSGIAVAVVAGTGGYLVLADGLSLGTLTVCIAYMTQLVKPIEKLNDTAASISSGIVRAERIVALLRSEQAVTVAGSRRVESKIEEIACEGVAYRYPGAAHDTVAGLSARFRRGECVALVGPSGSGKSTILRLVMRLVEPSEGALTVNGALPYTDLEPHALRSDFAVLMQTPHLFSGTIREVVAELEPAASDEQVLAVLADVQLRDLVDLSSRGLDTRLDEAGASVSGGQRARLLLARALLARRSVLILDEPFANIDDTSKTIILAALTRAKAKRIMIVVSHEQRLIGIADRVLTPQDWCRPAPLPLAGNA
jgi:ABC-type bacteriocin/lantibiotic exporter with double-glycine peptidase domain